MRKTTVLLTACTLALPMLSAGAVDLEDGQVRIELRPLVIARQRQVKLGEVALLRTRDLATIQQLVALPLGHGPRAGNEIVVRRDVIARWLRSHLGIRKDQIVWAGADESRLRTAARHLPAATFEPVARTALQQWLESRTTRYHVEAIAIPQDVLVPVGPVVVKPRVLPLHNEPGERMTIWLDVEVAGEFVRAVPVSFLVHAYREGWVAPNAIASGVSLTRGMIEKREIQIARGPSHAAAAIVANEPPSGLRSTRSLKSGEALTQQNVESAPLVARGDWVVLHLTSGAVELQRRAQALQDGRLGQVVKVRAESGTDPVAGRVTAAGRVEATL